MNKFFNIEWHAVGASVLAYVTSFFSPIAPFLVLIMILVAADLVTGIHAAKARGEPVRSFGIRRTIGKVAMYWIVVISSQLVVLMSEIMAEQYNVSQLNVDFLTYIVVVLIAYAEYKSVVENVEKGTGITIWSFIKILFRIGKK